MQRNRWLDSLSNLEIYNCTAIYMHIRGRVMHSSMAAQLARQMKETGWRKELSLSYWVKNARVYHTLIVRFRYRKGNKRVVELWSERNVRLSTATHLMHHFQGQVWVSIEIVILPQTLLRYFYIYLLSSINKNYY